MEENNKKEISTIDIEPKDIQPSLSLDPKELQKQLIDKIIDCKNKNELQEQLDIFNLAQSKNNILRTIKLNSFLEKIEDQAIERFTRKPDQIANKELLEYFQVISNQIDKLNKTANESISEKPLIQINNNKNELNVKAESSFNAESKEKIIDAVGLVIKQLEKLTAENVELDNNHPIADEKDAPFEETKE